MEKEAEEIVGAFDGEADLDDGVLGVVVANTDDLSPASGAKAPSAASSGVAAC